MEISSVFHAIRLTSHDTSTPEGRAKERYRRALLSTIASVGSRSISLISMLLLAPLTIDYLGVERYGMWMIISSITAMLAFADLGIGNGLLNAISYSHGRNDDEAARQYVSNAYFMLSGVAVSLGILFSVIYYFVDWAHIFNVSSSVAVSEAGPSIAVFVACFLLSMPLGVVQRVQQGYQEGFIDSFWVAVGKILGLVGVILVIRLRLGIPWLVVAFSGAPVLALAMNSGNLFLLRKRWLRPRIHDVTWRLSKELFQIGSLFLVLQIAITIAFSSDSIVVAQVVGPEGVAEYSVVRQLFMVVSMGLGMLLGPLWPAYGEAFARNDIQWVRRTFIRSIFACIVIGGVPSLILVALGKKIIVQWIGIQISPSQSLLSAFGLWTVLLALNNANAMLLNSAQVIRFQAVIATLMALTNLGISIALCYQLGTSGVVWGSVVATTFWVLVPTILYLPRIFQENWWRDRRVL